MRDMTRPFSVYVLLSRDLMPIITEFQPGCMYEDMLVFTRDFIKTKPLDIHAPDGRIDPKRVGQVVSFYFERWLVENSDFARLPRLFASLEYMAPAVMYFAMAKTNYSLLDYLHKEIDLQLFLPCNFIDLAAEVNNLAVLSYHHTRGHRDCTTAAMDFASRHGNLEMVHFLHSNYPTIGCTEDALRRAVGNGHVAVVDFLARHQLPSQEIYRVGFGTTELFDKVAADGRLEMLQFLYSLGWNGSGNGLASAVRQEHVKVVEWLVQHVTTGPAMQVAADEGNLKLLILLHEQTPSDYNRGLINLDKAAANGHLAVLEYLHAHGATCTPKAMDVAIDNGHMEVVRWLCANQTEGCAANTLQLAADRGDLKLLALLHPPTGNCLDCINMDKAAANGYQDVVQYLHVHGGTCSTDAIDFATENDHLDVVQWLCENRTEGCTIKALQVAADRGKRKLFDLLRGHNKGEHDRIKMDTAAANGYIDILEYLHDHGATCTTDAMDLAAGKGHFEVVQWLDAMRTEGCTVNAMDVAAGRNDRAMVEYLFNASCSEPECSTKAMDNAAAGGHLDMLQWLRMNTTAGCTNDAVDQAARGNHWDVVKWLFANCKVDGSAKGPELAASNGHLELAKRLLEIRHLPCTTQVAISVARYGDVNLLQWLVEKYSHVATPHLLQSAVRGGHEATVEWVLCNVQRVCPGCAMDEAKDNERIARLLDAASNPRCRICRAVQASKLLLQRVRRRLNEKAT
ncbi:Aste57867_3767 [Aphanomyces stellatus]|uniref:Aste57867_3767 protein n=1 Tax=Aphanomyces stellatus TaxID=120398 RepID=A0A485KE70_9STRA|nr:hypothetical protein As57867_003756 [Aphanomyces stellatus]VFT80918.1 Aste57867_3767 [Aphanomyces stellatus]